MGTCSSDSTLKDPANWEGPFIMIGDIKGNIKQYAIFNDDLKFVRHFPKVYHDEDFSGFNTLVSFLQGEVLLSISRYFEYIF